MFGVPFVVLFVPFEHRERDDPGEAHRLRVVQLEFLRQASAQTVQSGAGDVERVRNNQNHVAVFRAGDFQNLFVFLVREFFRCRRGNVAVFHLEPDKPFRLEIFLDVSRQLVNRLAGILVGALRNDNRSNPISRFRRTAKDLEIDGFGKLGQVDNFHTETEIRLVRTIAFHGFVIVHARQRQLEVKPENLLRQVGDHAVHERENVFHLDKRHLNIQLSEFRLTVGAEVFVTETARQLNVTVVSGNHEQLFVQLRGLGQGVVFARMNAAWNQIISSAFGSGSSQHRGFDFDKPVSVCIVAQRLNHAMAQHQRVLHSGAAQVQISILQSNVFAGQFRNARINRRLIAFVEKRHLSRTDFDFSGRHVRVRLTNGSSANLARYLNDVLHFQPSRQFEQVFARFRGKCRLSNPVSVSEVDENQSALIANSVDPTANRYFLSNMFRPQGAARVCSVHNSFIIL